MKRVKMVLAYDGTNYCGWQLQPNGITIEGVLNQALSELLREPVAVIGASRTDSGVHAEGRPQHVPRARMGGRNARSGGLP